jgi:UDPglucose--hexose-1-phosphate uridylyltransferase
MPELRQNIVTKEWVIIASERAKRPNAFVEPEHSLFTHEHEAHDPNCPFCPGNEEVDLEVDRMPKDGAWQTRTVRNKFPALAEVGELKRTNEGVRRRIAGVGYHDVVVEHPHHNMTIAMMKVDEIQLVLEAFQRRGKEIIKDPRIEHITYFKNHGVRAGASLLHPHSQIIALPVVPSNVRRRVEESRRYFDDMGDDVFRKMLEDELASGERMVVESDHFAVFVLYAALSPFHIWIVPKQQRDSFLDIEFHELRDLAGVLRNVLHRIYRGLHDPSYNMIIRSGPVKETSNLFFHWYISLVPRVNRMAGFEMGSGMHINSLKPEDAADFLRSCPAPPPETR